ncbi:MAG: acetyl-CoA carboxylase carboxyltransferase subunit alpha [bacterium]|nr:acetyl-CoA carboxylase carboxyltransferase subunit alpha [bacterium]
MSNEIIWLDFEKPIAELEHKLEEARNQHNLDEVRELETKLESVKREVYANLTPWQRVKLARHPKRPYSLDYIKLMLTDFIEFHGDRRFADDKAIVAGPAKLEDTAIMVIAQQKGRDMKENVRRNFGMMHPEGYRKALRLMQLAEKFSMPVLCIIDTPGAFPGIGAEERGISEAIALNLREMASLKTPIVAVVIGEGGSGGALGIGVANIVLMLENAYYSVISPEGAAAILWRDAAKAPQAAEALKITAQHLLQLGVIDEIVPEPLGGAHRDYETTAATLKQYLIKHFNQLADLSTDQLIEQRYQKFRNMGKFIE